MENPETNPARMRMMVEMTGQHHQLVVVVVVVLAVPLIGCEGTRG